MVGAEDPDPVAQQVREQGQRPGRIPAAAGKRRDVVAGGQGLAMVGAVS
jgi:hypothetical protein